MSTVEVVLRDVPTATYLAARRYLDGLISAAGDLVRSVGADSPEAEVLLAVAAIHDDPHRAHATDQVAAAHGAGRSTVDVVLHVDDPSPVRLVVRGLELVDAADRYCRLGSLPMPPADPDVASFIRWFGRTLDLALAAAVPEDERPL